ncbi:hypothetical protein [Paenibacillus aestuarii]|uniref:Uncharacterized protein n=1 Tax=Paenibacillus aestuarii TaxID=516965 RepID=A0ABW0KE31_9BACL|nr:hypothetical protein [Paenibacillus aestuarii]
MRRGWQPERFYRKKGRSAGGDRSERLQSDFAELEQIGGKA